MINPLRLLRSPYLGIGLHNIKIKKRGRVFDEIFVLCSSFNSERHPIYQDACCSCFYPKKGVGAFVLQRFFVIIKLWCLMLIKNQFHILNNALLRFLIRFVQLYSLQSAFLLKLHQFLLRHFLLNLKNCSI